MPSEKPAREVVRRLSRRLPTPVRREFSLLLQRLHLRNYGPLVSMVVPAHDTQADFLDEALHSLRAQTHGNLDVIVTPHGQCAKVQAIARQHAQLDRRVRVCKEVSSSLGGARNRGAKMARGAYLGFAGAADVVPPAAVQNLVAVLEETGSEFAVGKLSRADAPVGFGASGQQVVHRRQRLRTSISDFPEVITDAFEENRLFRRSFWKDAALEFPERDRTTVRSPVVEAYLRASAFDVLPDVTYRWMNRGNGLPFGHLQNAMDDLADWLTAQRETVAVLRTGMPAARDAWVYGVLDTDAIPFLDDVERASDHQWADLREYLESLVESVGAEVWSRVRAQSRVKVWLAVHDHRAELEDFVAQRWFEQDNMPTEVRTGAVYGILPFYGDERLGVPDSCYRLSDAETALNLSLRDVRWSSPTTLEVDLYTFIRYVAFDDETPVIEAALVDGTTQARLPLPVRHHVDPKVTRAAGLRYQNYDRGAFTVTVDAADLAAFDPAEPESGSGWWLEVSVSVHGVTRTGTINHRDERGSAGALRTALFAPRPVGDRLVEVVPDRECGMRLLTRSGPRVTVASATVSGRVVEGVLDCIGAAPRTVHVSRGAVEVHTALEASQDGLRFRLALPAASPDGDAEIRNWKVRARWEDGFEEAVSWPVEVIDSWLEAEPGSEVAVHRTPLGNVEVSEVSDTAAVDEVRLTDGALRVTGRWLGTAPTSFTLVMVGRRAELTATEVSNEGRDFEVEIPTRWDEWGLGTSSIPGGQYRLGLVLEPEGAAAPGRLVISKRLMDRLAEEPVNHDFRMRVARAGADIAVNLSPPITDDERGPYAQRRLQQWLLAGGHEIDEKAVYLQSYAGASATDSQLAIHQELRRRRPDLTLYWGVKDRSATVPEGGVPVVMYSRDWYRVLATSRYLVNNIDFDRWFVKQPGQYFLQTFHGYPAKSMGIRLWTAKQFTPRRIELELERTSRDWDLILTPCPEMDRYYREEYRYDGKIHSKGYPRDDILRLPEAEEVRRATRERLGIRDDQKVVLYAPTWRDDLATSHRSAPLVRHLDLETASQRLGDDFVLLMRGHRFHAKGAQRSEKRARLLDVTDYPEINDLILASDAAVLDYSSLRFDFALTGRPMLFLVPDLHLYTGGVRGFLYDFRDTAPGPLLDTADHVVEQLRDLDGVAVRHAADYRRFNEKYNYLQDGHATERVVAEFFGS